jgi:ATP-binding cassette subfamily B protein
MFVTMIFIMLPRAAVSMKRIGQVLDTQLSITDPQQPKAIQHADDCTVEFRHVSFCYPDSEEKVLDDISFKARPGQTTAVIGGTGSGKSTLINLIPRFFDATEGAVLLGGTDVKELTQKELRSHIGMVPQKGILFSGTIESNLRYGNENASEEELIRAAEIAQAIEFINEKPNGLKEEIAQGGTNVSGGQQQRLCIARALVKNPDVLVFDDSFSALDFSTDRALRKALKENIGGRTFIIVAQRINTIMDADQIIVLDNGRVAGLGTHEELLRSCDIYKEIALSQLSEEELGRETASGKEVN